MPIGLVSPGTKVREVDLTQGRIDSVSTTTGAIVCPFAQGPVEEPVFIDSEQALIDTFGKPSDNDNHYEYWLSASNYLTYGGVMRVVRVDGTNLNNANASKSTPGGSETLKIKSYEDYQNDYTTASTWFWAANNPGSWANEIKVCVIDGFADQIISGVNTSNNNVRVGAAITQTISGVVAGNGTTSQFTGFIKGIITGVGNTLQNPTSSGVGTDSITVRVVSTVSSGGTETAAIYTEGGLFSFSAGTIGVSSVTIGSGTSTFTSTTQQDWYDLQDVGLNNSDLLWKEVAERPRTSNFATNRSGKNDEIHIVVIDDKGTISGTPGTILEKFVGLSKAVDATSSTSGPIYYKNFIADNSQYLFAGDAEVGRPTGFSSGITSITNGDGAWGLNAQGTTYHAVGKKTYTLKGGNNYGSNDSANPRFETTLGDLIAGYDLFVNQREYPINFLIQGPGFGTKEQTQAKANKLIQIAELRKDCIACISPQRSAVLVDPGAGGSSPAPIVNTGTQTTNVISFFDSVASSSYAVFDTGYKYQFDRFSNKFRYVPLNADVAGCMARTGINDFAWYSPAGTRRGVINNAVKLAYNPSQSERDRLYVRRINPVIFAPGSGIILFGDKTGLAVPSAFDRINVRRLFLVLEESIERASRASLFEFNDAITRTNFVNITEPFLRDVKAKRGIQDFVVICDETNNTPDVIDANEFKADIYIKPARSINFIGLTFVATRTGVSFEEIIGRV
jgi:phage tail sheath protein FI